MNKKQEQLDTEDKTLHSMFEAAKADRINQANMYLSVDRCEQPDHPDLYCPLFNPLDMDETSYQTISIKMPGD